MKNLKLTLERWKIVKACRRARGWFTKPVPLANILSFFYLVVLVSLALTIDACEEGEIVGETSWLTQQLNCMTHNELGDFLAGAFAPLAFLWLVVAVFIQSKELAEQRKVLVEQRKELELTRAEYKLNRDEMKASTEQLANQTKVLREEQTLRMSVENDKLFREFFSQFELKSKTLRLKIEKLVDIDDFVKGRVSELNKAYVDVSHTENVAATGLQLLKCRDAIQHHITNSRNSKVVVKSWRVLNKNEFQANAADVEQRLSELIDLLPKTSLPLQSEFRHLDFPGERKLLLAIMEDAKTLPD